MQMEQDGVCHRILLLLVHRPKHWHIIKLRYKSYTGTVVTFGCCTSHEHVGAHLVSVRVKVFSQPCNSSPLAFSLVRMLPSLAWSLSNWFCLSSYRVCLPLLSVFVPLCTVPEMEVKAGFFDVSGFSALLGTDDSAYMQNVGGTPTGFVNSIIGESRTGGTGQMSSMSS